MGAGVSAGECNDDLVDNLIEALYIRTLNVERVFRAVDRGCYFLVEPHVNAYRDVAWKSGNYHISAPCIYSEVMEGLNLSPGLSFLNLGSGTGYLNTMAGLLLGSSGINHGVELHADVVSYAYKKLSEFKRLSGAVDEFDFCEPKFAHGNCLSVSTASSRRYDRVYCGAGCPQHQLNAIKSFVKLGGVLIVPVNEELLEMRREAETRWTMRVLLPVAFAHLVQPQASAAESVNLPDVEPRSLQELCRATIRNLLRKNIDIELKVKEGKKSAKVRSLRRDKKLLESRRQYFKNVRQRNTEDYYDFFLLTLRHHEEGHELQLPARGGDSESSSTNTTLSTDPEKSSSSDSDDDSSIEDKMSSLQEIFMDFMSAPESTEADSCDKKTEDEGPTASASQSVEVAGRRTSNKRNKNKSKRSGRGKNASTSSSGVVVSSSEDEQEEESKRVKRATKLKERRCNYKWRKVQKRIARDEGEESGCVCANDALSTIANRKMYVSRYSGHMESRIRQLPLPIILKKYLHLYREL